ncbi:MAG: hypothetical protein KKB20_21460 [Proteobacteria bacterium]|nr:hypothetical protein [Pseudomonadota bacterium]
MTGFEGNARLYGLEGWQGIGRKFMGERGDKAATLGQFASYLDDAFVLLRRPDVGSRADEPMEAFLKDAQGEAGLGDIFTELSIFSVW